MYISHVLTSTSLRDAPGKDNLEPTISIRAISHVKGRHLPKLVQPPHNAKLHETVLFSLMCMQNQTHVIIPVPLKHIIDATAPKVSERQGPGQAKGNAIIQGNTKSLTRKGTTHGRRNLNFLVR